MAMARQFFDAQKSPALLPSFPPAQVAPIQDLMSRQLPSPVAAPNFNDAWADVQRAPSLPHNAFSSAAWANEFSPAAFAPGPLVQQTVAATNGASTL
jgi:hypothetical protein